jgi:DNA ligase-1
MIDMVIIYEKKKRIPLQPFFFDVLYLGGTLILNESYRRRWEILSSIVDREFLIPRRVVKDEKGLDEFLRMSIEMGHEGLMAKKMDSPYTMGARGKLWLKLKPAHTLDLVVVGAEWGHGRRKGWLSNYLLAARDPESGVFLPVGKTFKGLSDAEFEWMTENLLKVSEMRLPYAILVKPKIVVEVAFNEIQKSRNYPSGFALRFARILRIRTEKSPREADTIDRVREIYRRQFQFKGKVEL